MPKNPNQRRFRVRPRFGVATTATIFLSMEKRQRSWLLKKWRPVSRGCGVVNSSAQFPSVDLDLLSKGWHVVYLNGCSNTFGSPETMEHWAALYKTLTTEYGMSKKPVLYGMSRGGLYVYNWAAAHPDSVGMIYGDAAVCDIHSWPGGKFKGTGSSGDWKLFKQIYHLESDEQAMEWKKYNPIDILEPIAKARIPIIHVCGDADTAVPMAENTDVLKERYEKLGGHVELIVKKGVGHHPHSLADPKPIVDYILKARIPD